MSGCFERQFPFQRSYSSLCLKKRFVGKKDKGANFAVISHMILIFRIWLKMSKRIQMIKFELNLSPSNVVTRIDDCCYGYKISIATKSTLALFYHE